jgi:predicted transcriptional regulator
MTLLSDGVNLLPETSEEAVLQAPEALVMDLLSALKAGPRPYDDIMDAWRTSCPRLPVWEDALDQGWIERERNMFILTEAGRQWLAAHP